MADAQRKPTPAQRRRLEQIARGQITRRGESWITGFYHTTGTATGGITYTMMSGLHDAGWIVDEPTGDDRRYRLVLTDAGRSALGLAPLALQPGEPLPPTANPQAKLTSIEDAVTGPDASDRANVPDPAQRVASRMRDSFAMPLGELGKLADARAGGAPGAQNRAGRELS